MFFSQTGNRLTIILGQAEAHDMGSEIQARCFKRHPKRARVGVAGFNSAGDQDDGGLGLG